MQKSHLAHLLHRICTLCGNSLPSLRALLDSFISITPCERDTIFDRFALAMNSKRSPNRTIDEIAKALLLEIVAMEPEEEVSITGRNEPEEQQATAEPKVPVTASHSAQRTSSNVADVGSNYGKMEKEQSRLDREFLDDAQKKRKRASLSSDTAGVKRMRTIVIPDENSEEEQLVHNTTTTRKRKHSPSLVLLVSKRPQIEKSVGAGDIGDHNQ